MAFDGLDKLTDFFEFRGHIQNDWEKYRPGRAFFSQPLSFYKLYSILNWLPICPLLSPQSLTLSSP